MLGRQLLNGLTLGAIYALIALGYTLVYGVLGMINFAHSEVLMAGAFLAAWAAARLPRAAGPGAVLAALALAMAGAGALNALIERAAYRPLRGRGRMAPLISALGVSIVLQNAVFLCVSTQSVAFPELVAPRALAGLTLGAALALMLALSLFIGRTRAGRAMRACAQDPEAASLMGVDVDRVIAGTFLLGGALGGAAGVLYGLSYGSIKYNMGFLPGVKAFTAAVLGGIGSVPGAVLGGFLLGVLEVLAAGYLPAGAEWRDAAVFAALILILLFRPAGLLGEAAVEKL